MTRLHLRRLVRECRPQHYHKASKRAIRDGAANVKTRLSRPSPGSQRWPLIIPGVVWISSLVIRNLQVGENESVEFASICKSGGELEAWPFNRAMCIARRSRSCLAIRRSASWDLWPTLLWSTVDSSRETNMSRRSESSPVDLH